MINTPELESIDILGQTVEIRISEKSCDINQCDGYYIDNLIVLREQYTSLERLTTVLFHEVFHALSGILGTQMNITVEEVLASAVGNIAPVLMDKMLVAMAEGIEEDEETPSDTECEEVQIEMDLGVKEELTV